MTIPRKLTIGVSTKMYFGWNESLHWIYGVRDQLRHYPLDSSVALFVVPSLPVLPVAVEILAPLGVTVGAQTSSWADGPLTGEVSPRMLGEIGVRLVEVGHAERRRLFGETDAVVRRKTNAILEANLTPLLCVGELEKNDADAAATRCIDQVVSALEGNAARLSDVMIAYEPVWAIGSAHPAPIGYINDVIGILRATLSAQLGRPTGSIIYGGSAGPGMLGRLIEADGLFLGRSAHDPAALGDVIAEALDLKS